MLHMRHPCLRQSELTRFLRWFLPTSDRSSVLTLAITHLRHIEQKSDQHQSLLDNNILTEPTSSTTNFVILIKESGVLPLLQTPRDVLILMTLRG